MPSLTPLFFQDCLPRIVRLVDASWDQLWDQFDLHRRDEVGQERCAGIVRVRRRLRPSGKYLPDNQQQISAVLNRIWCMSNRFQTTYGRKHSGRKIKKSLGLYQIIMP
jgi:hypothetical protein